MNKHVDGYLPNEGWTLVFGSNLSGLHHGGAARQAYQSFGAYWGQPIGPMGDSYAIPTKNAAIDATLPLHVIEIFVDGFIKYAKQHPEKKFFITRIGAGLAGYTDEIMAPMFKDVPDNCSVAEAWYDIIERTIA